MNVGSLFSGIGGFDLGLERAGMRIVWQCESDDYCRRVLAKHWPAVPCFGDVRELRGSAVAEVDVLAGGFPCQDISSAGAKVGIDGARSGLWSEYARLIGELRPRYVVVENVAALLARGLGRVLGDLAAVGYDAEWDCIPASAVGAPHRRDRVWLVAYPDGDGESGCTVDARPGRGLMVSHAASSRRGGEGSLRPPEARGAGPCGLPRGSGWWEVEPAVDRVAHGIPGQLDRVRALGNALVPQIAEWIGRRIMTYEGER